jgi:hypothetical protein
MSVLRFKDPDYPFGIFKLVLFVCFVTALWTLYNATLEFSWNKAQDNWGFIKTIENSLRVIFSDFFENKPANIYFQNIS